VSPAEIALSGIGATVALTVTGTYDDGSSRDLTRDSGTTYTFFDPPGIVSVSKDGVVTALAIGTANVSTWHGKFAVRRSVRVVSAENHQPIALVGGPYAGNTGASVAFTSAGSIDADGDALQFAWDFGDGTSSSQTNPSHAFATAGAFTVRLTVSDGRGGTATATTTATITTPIAPTSLAVSPDELTINGIGAAAALTVTGQFPDGTTRNLTLDSGTTYTVDPPGIVSVSKEGVVTALAVGTAKLATWHGKLVVRSTVQVSAAPINRQPIASAGGPYTGITGQQVAFSSAGSSDPDGDTLQYAWDFGDGATGTGAVSVHSYAAPGSFSVTLTVTDGRGGTATATGAVTVALPPITLTALGVSPSALRFSEANATAALLVTGHYSDNSERDLTGSATGTTYVSSAPQVATVSTEGIVTSSANGNAGITITNSGIVANVAVVVEIGVTMEALELTPPIITIRELASTAQVTVRGRFSDGSLRDLTPDAGTTYALDTAIATVSAGGLLQATAPGDGVLTARNGALSATSQVRVIVTDGAGFLRGEVYDDGRSLPLDGARVTPLIAGGVPVPSPQSVDADDRGRFTVGAAAGAALVRVEKDGYTIVERRSTLANGAIDTLLDARLTRVDTRVNQLQSVFGGEATSADNSVALTIPAGSLDQDAALRVTPISAQGLQGLLPTGWSPIAAVDLQPADRSFAQGATLRVPQVDLFGAGAQVAVARYDAGLHQWVVQAAGVVSSDRRTIAATIVAAGQYAFVVPDDAPLIPPAAQPGEALAGVSAVIVPESSSATGSVVPRTAPPGEAARAVGTVILQPPTPLSSGAVLRARVTEQFDLLDSSRITPQPFVQDVVLYARPRLGDAGTLAARLPISPSLQFTIQQLSLGTVRLDVTIAESSAANSIIGSTGGSVADANGDVLTLPAGAIGAEIAVGLLALNESGLSAAVPASMTLLGAVFVDAPGASFAVPAELSIARPAGVDDGAQVIVAQVITDNSGGRRFKIAGVGLVSPTRIAIQTTLASLVFDGVRSGGEFVFLRSSLPLGFINGAVTAATSPQSLALVTASTAPFAFLTSSSGAFIVAGRAGVETVLTAVEPAGAAAAGNATLNAVNAIAAVNLALSHTSAIVTGTIPAANAVNVALDSSIVIDFSKPIDPASISPASVILRVGTTDVAASRVLSANRRRLTVTPAAPLLGLTNYSLSLSADVRDAAANALVPFGPQTFTTLDPSKATALALGLVTAELPDEDGMTLISGGPGASEAGQAVVATNLRTQETVTVLSEPDGSFRIRLAVIIGDEVAITLRDATGRETNIAITQFTSIDGRTSIGAAGGTVLGRGGRLGRILPRALASAGTFAIETATTPPPAPSGVTVIDRFELRIDNAAFKRLESLTLSESQRRFEPVAVFAAPFVSSGSLTIPADFLVSASLRFNAAAVDRDGTRHSAAASTVVVAGSPDTSGSETAFGDSFPAVFLTTQRQALPSQVIEASAVAPAARVDLDVPLVAAIDTDHALLVVRESERDGEPLLAVVDRMTRVDVNGASRLRTSGRSLPGATTSGSYAIVSGPFAFVEGRASGPAVRVTVDGLPFMFETDGANGNFVVPVLAGGPFVLRFVNAGTGAVLGTANGQAPANGQAANIGSPLAPVSTVMTVTTEPDSNSVVEIAAPLVFHFSEPLDPSSVTAAAFVITDPAGARQIGRVALSDGSRAVTFRPLRRWAFGTRYRYGVSPSVMASSGARLASTASGEFTTFSPTAVGVGATGVTLDAAANGQIAAAATSSGLQIVNISSPASPTALSQLLLDGGGRAVATIGSPLTDRNGAAVTGSLIAVASGDAASGARLSVIDMANPAAPAVLGTTLLPPGIPRQVIVTADRRALVAIEGAGVVSVQLGTMIPDDPTDPTRAINARYPTSGVASVTGIASLGTRVVASGPSGLAVLDAATLAPRHSLETGAVDDVAAIQSFRFDTDGDGSIESNEVFDLAILSGGAENSLQFVRVPADADPVLIGAVRLPAPSRGVALDAAESLAYVTIGARGLALVDLMGPASVQPIDGDHNGADDRILGLVDTAGTAQHITPVLSRGIGLVADGAAGLSVVRLLPARVRITDVRRDPVTVITGEEQSILQTRTAFTTDDALRVEVEAALGTDAAAIITVEETPAGGGARALSFATGATATLQAGANSIPITVDGAATSGSQARIVIRRQSGEILTTFDVAVKPPPSSPVQSLRIGPANATIGGSDADDLQLGVAGFLEDGTVVNVTRAPEGTTYLADSPVLASVSSDGMVNALAGGEAIVEARNGGAIAEIAVTIDRPAAIVEFAPELAFLTLRQAGEQAPVPLAVLLSSGQVEELSTIAAQVTLTSSDPAVATASNGVITAVGEGAAIVEAAAGAVVARIQVAVQLRAPPTITGIELSDFDSSSTDRIDPIAAARVLGTGSLDGLEVVLSLTGPSNNTLQLLTGLDGAVGRTLSGLAAGNYTVTASITDMASGQSFQDSKTLVMLQRGGDIEPNDAASPSVVLPNTPIDGSLDVGDTADTFSLQASAEGTATIRLSATSGSLADVTLVVRTQDGQELARFTAAQLANDITLALPAAGALLSIESGSGLVYRLAVKVAQTDVTISAVSPLNGGPGTRVTIAGRGFSGRMRENMVMFGGVSGRVELATATQLIAVVPANAPNGPIKVVSGAREASGPMFVTGLAVKPPSFMRPDLERLLRDPVSGRLYDVTCLRVTFDPLATRLQVEEVASRVGATITGFFANGNLYTFTFAGHQTLAALYESQARLRLEPLVERTSRSTPLFENVNRFDYRDRAGKWPGTKESRGRAFEQIRLSDAINAVRSTPPFDQRASLKPVKVAVIDSGFMPHQFQEEFFQNGALKVRILKRGDDGLFHETPNPFNDADLTNVNRRRYRHGTKATGVIAALNNGHGMSGVLNSLAKPGEAPFDVTTFFCHGATDRTINPGCLLSALDFIGQEGNFDAVNLSLSASVSDAQSYLDDSAVYSSRVQPLAGRTLFVAAGSNESIKNDYYLPVGLENQLPNVIGIGAVAVGDHDKTGDDEDQRAIFKKLNFPANRLGAIYKDDKPCSGVASTELRDTGSNCGLHVNVAAPGERVYTTDVDKPYAEYDGTSAASPIVVGVAGILQAVRPTQAHIPPETLRQILIDSGDDISLSWSGNDQMRRLNALAAVRAVVPGLSKQRIYVSDNEAPNGGAVILLDIDPLTGALVNSQLDNRVLRASSIGVSVKPSSAVASPAGDRLFVLGHSNPGDAVGDGLLIINTLTDEIEKFIPFSEFPNGGGPPTAPVSAPVTASIAVSQDGRIVYVPAGQQIVIVNVENGWVVRRLGDLPPHYRNLADDFPDDELANRMDGVRSAAGEAIGNLFDQPQAALEFSDAVMAADGKTLYVTVRAGGGMGNQPGIVMPIDVDLYRDGQPVTPGLDSDLTSYFVAKAPLSTSAIGSSLGGDEPSAVEASPDGRHVYMLNGGMKEFTTLSPQEMDFTRYEFLTDSMLLGARVGMSGGIAGLMTTIHSFREEMNNLFNEMLLDLKLQADSGRTLLNAPGVTDVFSTGPTAEHQWLFPSEIGFGWNPDPINGGRVVNQFRFRNVFAKRPFGMSIRPDGRRALVSYFQTGNFGVLDRATQTAFGNPNVGGLPDTMFTGVVAVTPAVRLDNHLWPRRGAYQSPDGQFVPSPDEALLYPGPIKYSQNGYFAAAVHTGVRPPQVITAQLPDFVHDTEAVLSLNGIGFSITPGESDGSGPAGEPVQSRGMFQFARGGGAVTILRDEAIGNDLTNAQSPADGENGSPRPFFAQHPLCAEHDLAFSRCVSDVYTRVFEYRDGGAPVKFVRPRGVAIQPFVMFEAPRFGDVLRLASKITAVWRDPHAAYLDLRVFDLGTAANPLAVPVQAGSLIRGLNSSELNSRSTSPQFKSLFSTAPVDGHRYRLIVHITTATDEILATASIDVRYQK
jgi:PKD repeat protein